MTFFTRNAAPLVATCLLLTSATTASANNNYWNHFQNYNYNTTKPSITDIIGRSGGEYDQIDDFDILLNALTTAGLGDVLADTSSNLTLLAPTDGAFIRLAQDLGYTGTDEAGSIDAITATLTGLGNGDPIPLLTDILLYHVLPDQLRFTRIKNSDSIDTSLSGATITPDQFRLIDNEPDLENAKFVYPLNRFAANGFIHAVNRVLLPIDIPGNTISPTSNIVDIVAASGGDFDNDFNDYDILLTAVLATGLEGALGNAAADLTVFAPNDAAFKRLAYDFGYRGYNESDAYSAIVDELTELGGGDPIPLLTDILLYHVSPDSKTVKEVTDADVVNTLLTDSSFSSFGVFLIDDAPRLRAPKIISTESNLLATNGIVHTINRVLVPLDIAPTRRYFYHWAK